MKLRILIISFLVMALALNVGKSHGKQETEFQGYAKIWDYASKHADQFTVESVFKAIEVKQDKRFEKDIIEFIKAGDPTSANKARAIYTLAKLGNKQAEKFFNDLLIAHEGAPGHGRAEKPQALKFMKELGYKPSMDAVNAVKKDIAGFMKQKYPALALGLAAPLKLHGFDMSETEKKQLAELITNKWRNVDPDEMKTIGVQPDWDVVFASKDSTVAVDNLNALFLRNADLEKRKEILKSLAKKSEGPKGYKHKETILNASTNDKAAIDKLLGKFTLDNMMVINESPASFSDEILIKTLQEDSGNYNMWLKRPIFDELQKRGHQDAIDSFVSKAKKDSSIESHKKGLIEYAKIRAAFSLAQYDAGMALDLLSKQLEKSPNDSFVAHQLCSIIMTEGWPGMVAPGWKDWVRKNPEKLAKAIKTLIDTSDEKTLKKQYNSRDLGYDEWTINSHREAAFRLMPFLTDDIFNKYFADLDSNKLTQSAYVAGTLFGAKWISTTDQKEFYEKYDLRRQHR